VDPRKWLPAKTGVTAVANSHPLVLYSMADDAPRVLVCLVEGESLLFPVTPTGDMHIWDLQKLIKEETKNGVLNGVDSKDLILWKVMSL
jgi:hypothetical protein